jgi:CRISPR-associated protein Cas5d
MKKSKTFKLKVWGENACFTRPEMKVERVSYDVITPSAARGIFDAILWKPSILWKIEKIEVLNPIRWESVRRNELGKKIPFQQVTTAMNSGTGNIGLFIEEERQQRASLLLRDVAYVIHAKFALTKRAGQADSIVKFEEMFVRRVTKGQCHHQPVLGNREFPAYFELAEDEYNPISESKDLGWMLYDLDFENYDFETDESSNINPHFFRAEMKNGVIIVPDKNLNGARL